MADSDEDEELSESEEEEEPIENESDESLEHAYDDCIDCQYRRQMAVLDTLPETVVAAIQDACDEVNKGMINWLFRHRPIRILSLMTVPYVLPIDIAIVIICKLWQRLPSVKKELKTSFQNLLNFLQSFVVKMDKKRHAYSAKFSCQLAVTEYDYASEDLPKSKVFMQPSGSRMERNDSIGLNIPPRRVSKLEKAASFAGHRREDLNIKNQIHENLARIQRKSYAGNEKLGQIQRSTSNASLISSRRKSLVDLSIKQPERVIQKMNFGFKVDLSPSTSEQPERSPFSSHRDLSDLNEDDQFDADMYDDNMETNEVIETLKSLQEGNSEGTSHLHGRSPSSRDYVPIEIANRALTWEREYLNKCQVQSEVDSESFDEIIEQTRQHDALMAFYYTDENNQVKVTEIFMVDPDSSDPDNHHQNCRRYHGPDKKQMDQQEIIRRLQTEDSDGFPENPTPSTPIDPHKQTFPQKNKTPSSPSSPHLSNQRQRKKSRLPQHQQRLID